MPTKKKYDQISRSFQLYTPAEAAAILNVSLRTVRKWIQSGALAHTRLGQSRWLIRIRAEDLKEFAKAHYQDLKRRANHTTDVSTP